MSERDDWWLNVALGAIAVLAGVVLLLHVTAGLAALVTAGHWVNGGRLSAGFDILVHPGDPAAAWPPGSGVPGPMTYWATLAGLLVLSDGLAWTGWRWYHHHRHSPARRRARVHATAGVASRAEVRRYASPRALLRRGANLRPTLANPAARDLGFRLGTSRGAPVWSPAEESRLLLGPPRSGKGLHLVVPMILDAPGAVVTTSTRPDNLAATLRLREQHGPVAVFDPQHLAGVDARLRWSPIRGCTDPQTAIVRARCLAAGAGFAHGGVNDSAFWQGQTEAVLRALLHAAALDDSSIDRLYAWSVNPVAAEEATLVLLRNPDSAEGWADGLDAAIHMDPRTRDSVWAGVRAAMAALADPRVRRALDPAPGAELDVEEFLCRKGTLYLLGTGAGAGAAAAFLAALLEDITETARRLAAQMPGGRLDPPLTLVLDEIANLSPLPSLPTLMADGGGNGISTTAVLQSLAQARDKWGEQPASAIWEAATAKVILGGASSPRDLQDLSQLIGERDEQTVSTSRDPRGGRSTSTAIRRVPVLPPDALRTLPFGTAVLLLRATRPIILDLQAYNQRHDAHAITESQHSVAATGLAHAESQ